MASPSVDKHVFDDNQHCDEPTTFPYLLTLDDDTKLLEDEPLEMMALEEESEKSSPDPMAARMLLTAGKTAEIPEADLTPNLTTTTPTTASSTATTPAATITNMKDTYPTKETISTILTQLADAQEEITSLRQRVEQSDMRTLEYEQRMITMENTLKQLVHLCPTLQDTFHRVCDSLAQMTQPSDPVEEDTGADVLDNKRKWEGNSNHNPTQQQTKRPKTDRACAAGSEEEKSYKGSKPFCSNCNIHHKGPCNTPCGKCSLFGHQAKNCRIPIKNTNPDAPKVCYKCGNTGHFRKGCPKLKNRNNNDHTNKKKARGGVIVNNTEKTEQNPSSDMGTFFFKDLTLSILYDTN